MLFPIRQQDLKNAKFSSAFGKRIHPITRKQDMHRGLDIAAPLGTPLIALDDGVVTISKVNNGGPSIGFGYYIAIQYSGGLFSLYAHMKQLSILKPGDKVKKGQIVGYIGSTGSSTGPHVHFEIHHNGLLFKSQVKSSDTAVDPLKYYPQLTNMLGKCLTNIKIEEETELDDKVKFEYEWQKKLLIQTLQTLDAKGALQDSKYWIGKVNSGTMTVSELGLLAIVMADRD